MQIINKYSVELIIGFLGTVLYFSPSWSESLEFNRFLIDQGQWWRLFSGQLVHFGPWHWWLDYAAVLLAAALSPIGFTWRGLCQIVLSFTMVAAVLWWFTEITHYRGISGVVYGWLLLAAWRCVWLDRFRKLLFSFVLGGKVLYDMLTETGWQPTAQWLDAQIAYEAHFAGLLSAFLILGYYFLLSLFRQAK